MKLLVCVSVHHRYDTVFWHITCLLFTDLNPTKHGLTIKINNQKKFAAGVYTFFHFFYFRDISDLAHECASLVNEKSAMF